VRVLRWELRKLLSQTRVRVALAVCLYGPPLFAVVLSLQSALPKDTLFGRHVFASGYALPLVVLGFASMWAFPLLTSLVAGDVFSSEDGHRTWPALLTRDRSRSEVFTGKVLASVVSAVVLLLVTAVSSLVAGLAVGAVGFFVIPVVGFFAGFPLGVYLAERARLTQHGSAWESTLEALRAIGLSILIELSATVLAAGVWLAVVLT